MTTVKYKTSKIKVPKIKLFFCWRLRAKSSWVTNDSFAGLLSRGLKRGVAMVSDGLVSFAGGGGSILGFLVSGFSIEEPGECFMESANR